MKYGKYSFTLKGVDVIKVDQKYGIKAGTQLPNPEKSTKITDLDDKTTPEIVSFLDETNHLRQCMVSMIDFKTHEETKNLKYNCFWCKHPFDSQALGCPLRFIESRATKTYYSEISKDVYIIKENVTESRANSKDHSENVEIEKRGYYETDGVFCSFQCCKSFIGENKNNRIYDKSLSLLMKMCGEMSDSNITYIDEAPHWRQLRVYGGHMTIEEFRRAFNKITYNYYGQYNKYIPIGRLYEEKITF